MRCEIATSMTASLLLFVDHDNVLFDKVSIREILVRWLSVLKPELSAPPIIHVRLRAYGGWFEEDNVTESRFRAAEFYQAECPAVFAFEGSFCRVSFEFADALLSGQGVISSYARITHTVVSRPAAQYLKVRPGSEPCEEIDCQLRDVRRWVTKSRACTRAACPLAFTDYFQRREQKQVDVHMAVDSLLFALGEVRETHLGIVSDDWDLLPAIAAAAMLRGERTISAIRLVGAGTYLDADLRALGINLIRMQPLEET